MTALRRMSAAGYSTSWGHTLSQIEAISEDRREVLVIPIERLFSNKREIVLPPFLARLARCGVPIYQKKIGVSVPTGEIVRFSDEKGFFALGEAMTADDGEVIKPIRQFDIREDENERK